MNRNKTNAKKKDIESCCQEIYNCNIMYFDLFKEFKMLKFLLRYVQLQIRLVFTPFHAIKPVYQNW